MQHSARPESSSGNTAAAPLPRPAANSRSTRGSSQHRHRQKAASAAACRVRPFSGWGRYSVRASAAKNNSAASSCQTAAVGCTLCQLDIREYANAYDRIKAKDAQLLVVLQSPASTINAQMKKEDLPFDIICDPDMGLYKEFELGVAASKEEMIRPEDMPKMGEKRAKMEEYGLSHGAYEGEEMQFPGYFLLDSELNVLEAHRATSILDMPSVDEMIAKQ